MYSNQVLNSSKHSYSYMFPYREDCILSHLRLLRPSSMTHIRSVSDTLPQASKSPLGSQYADCPILFIITVPEFITLGQIELSLQSLVEKALRGFPNNKICCNKSKYNLQISLAVSLGYFSRGHKWFSIEIARFSMAYCFLALVKRINIWLRPPIPLIILKTLQLVA